MNTWEGVLFSNGIFKEQWGAGRHGIYDEVLEHCFVVSPVLLFSSSLSLCFKS